MKNKFYWDGAIALTVVICSVALFLALALALSGTMLGNPGRPVRVNFYDVTGITPGAQVKYGGAMAGKVTRLRMLTLAERTASGDPRNAVEVTLALNENVPPLPSDIAVTVSADTLLSEKLILLEGGSPASPLLAEHMVLQGVAPTTFDELAREVDSSLVSLREILGGTTGETGDVFARIRTLLIDTQALIADAKPVLQDARSLAADAKQLIAENKEPITRTLGQTEKAVGALEQLATRSNNLLANNEKKLTATISDFKVAAENLKAASTYTKILTRNLALRPSQLVWNSKPPSLPTETQILQSLRPIPVN